jgi:flagella basal body P-ring formation protein FlgA
MITALALSFVAGFGGGTSDRVTVTLPAEAHVTGTEIRLGEIARVSGADAERVARVEAFDLGYVPAPGYSRLLGRDYIARDLRARLHDVEVVFAGQSRCRVFPLVETLAARVLRAEAKAALRELFTGVDVEITPRDRLADLALPAGERRLRVDLRERELRAGTWNVPVAIVIDGEPYRTVWTTWTVELWRSLPVLTQAVRRGEELTPALFTMRRVKVGTGRTRGALSPADFGAGTAVRDLAAGSVVTGRDVQREKLVHRGDIVSLEVKKGAISARAFGLAQQDGRAGDRIRVRMSTNGREVVAEVVARELVRITIQ